MAPEESFATAVNRWVSPTAVNPADGGEITMWATAWETTTMASPLTPDAVARTIAAPFPTAVTSPVTLSAVTTPELVECQRNVADTGLPSASVAVAENVLVRPSVARVSPPGVTAMLATTGGAVGLSFPLHDRANQVTARVPMNRTGRIRGGSLRAGFTLRTLRVWRPHSVP